jgi:protein N-terminal methyltransferase
MDSRGFDSTGREFSSATEMWAEEIGAGTSAPASTDVAPPAAAAPSNGDAGGGGDGKRKDWYSKGISYWQVSSRALAQPASPLPKP